MTRESKFVGIYVKEWDFILDIGYFVYTNKLIFCVYSYGDIVIATVAETCCMYK